MFLDKINEHANRISLNFLSFSGWGTLLIYFLTESGILSHVPLFAYLDDSIFGSKCIYIMAFQFLLLFVYAFLFALEQFFKFRITDKSFLADEDIAKFRAYGVGIFAIFSIVSMFGFWVATLFMIFDWVF